MQEVLLVLSAIFFTSLLLGIALAIAWSNFGRPRHALSWSLGYGLTSCQILLNACALLFTPFKQPLLFASLLCVLASGTLIALGARQRSDKPSNMKRLFGAAAVSAIVIVASGLFHALSPLGFVLPTFYTAVMLLIAIAAIRPGDRKPDPAEYVILASFTLFVLFEMLLGGLTYAYVTHPGDAHIADLYHMTYAIGLPPAFVASGVAAILLIASDLAKQLRTLAANDPLTGVLNRRGFYDAALRAVANGRRQRQSIAVAIADIDHFKSINDRYGHTAGDRTLHYICSRLTKGLRGGDIVGRIGGEEFALLLVNSSAEQAAEAMERIRAEIAIGYSDDGAPVPVTTSFGVAAILAGSASSEQTLAEAMDRADQALYRSKVEGRNRTTLAA
jgi:diguanylate cyclase (GGDEF)-like protein